MSVPEVAMATDMATVTDMVMDMALVMAIILTKENKLNQVFFSGF